MTPNALTSLVVVLFLPILTRGQSNSLVTCGLSCITSGVTAARCSSSDLVCNCNSQDFQSVARNCFTAACSSADAQSARVWLDSLCAGYSSSSSLTTTSSIRTSSAASSTTVSTTITTAATTTGQVSASTLSTSTASTSSTTISAPGSSASSASSSSGLSSSAKIGIGVGVGVGIVLILIIVGLLVFIRRSRRKQATKSTSAPVTTQENLVGTPSKPELDGAHQLPRTYHRDELPATTEYVTFAKSGGDRYQYDQNQDQAHGYGNGHEQPQGRQANAPSFPSRGLHELPGRE